MNQSVRIVVKAPCDDRGWVEGWYTADRIARAIMDLDDPLAFYEQIGEHLDRLGKE